MDVEPVQFGYSNENAEIVPVFEGCFGEAVETWVVRDMLDRSGFLAAGKIQEWKSEYWQWLESLNTKNDWLFRGKRYLLDRPYTRRLISMFHKGRWNPGKVKTPSHHYGAFSRNQKRGGVVVGNKAPREQREYFETKGRFKQRRKKTR